MSLDWLRRLPRASLDMGYGAESIARAIQGHLWRRLLTTGRSVQTVRLTGYPRADGPDLGSRLREVGGVVSFDSRRAGPASEPVPESLAACWRDAVVAGSWEKTGEVDIQVTAANAEALAPLVEAVRGFLLPEPERSWVQVLVEDPAKRILRAERGVRMREPLVPENYDERACEAFAHVVADIVAPTPCGRFVLLDGPPGTGKTHLVRGLVEAAGAATFLVVPPALGGALGRPDLLAVLLGMRRDAPAGSQIVVVVEDADACIVPRQADNSNSISTLLNASDGILGDALNLRIVATTNARHREIDPALLRPGRLCRRLTIEPLSPEAAGRVHLRLTGTRRTYGKPATLAEVYASTRGGSEDMAPSGSARRPAGFSAEPARISTEGDGVAETSVGP